MFVFTHIKGLAQVYENVPQMKKGAEMKNLPLLENAYLVVEGGKFAGFGPMSDYNPDKYDGHHEVNLSGRYVLPSFVDSHTHIVFAESREGEFVDRIEGLTYEEIAKKGGGILNSAQKLQRTSEDDLFESACRRVEEVMRMGTGALEIKSGYGLTLEDEIKMLRVAKRLKEKYPIFIKTTFLGAHAIPKSYSNRKDYVDLIVDKMIPQVAEEGLADYCDVFCDRGFFTPEETDRILQQGLRFGMKAKIHANELDYSGGIQVGVKNGAISVDHLEFTGEEEIETLLNSSTMPTLLPSTAFFLGLHYPPARKMIAAGLPVSLASDYNPGSSPSGNMSFVLSLACVKLKMTPEEAINAATVNAAYAMELENTHGHIRKGLDANFIVTAPMKSLAFIPYSFGGNHLEKVYVKGEKIRHE